jgi:hypothetical protein
MRYNLIHTITAENGKEFAKHQEIAKELDISFYFCKPCAILGNVALLRTAPKKRLGYLTPNEKFNLLLTNQNSGYICKLNSPIHSLLHMKFVRQTAKLYFGGLQDNNG